MPHPLRLRAFRLFFIGRALSSLGDAVIPAALVLAVLRATGSTADLALVLGCALVPRLLLLPLGGVVADRFNPRTVAMIADLVRCAVQLLVAIELFSAQPTLWHIAAASAVGGIAGAFALPASSPLIAATVAGPQRLKANSLLGITRSSTQLAGPAIAGLLIWLAGPGWAFVLDAASFAVSAGLLAMVRITHLPAAGHRSLIRDLVQGWVEVRTRDWFWSSLIAHATWNGVAAVLVTLGPAIAVHQLGGEGVWVAILQAGAVGLLAGSLLASRLTLKRPILVANLGLATYALPLVALAVAAPAPVVIGSYAIAMAALGLLSPVWATVVQSQVPAHALARVNSYDWLFSLAAMPLGYVLAPIAAQAWSERTPLLVAAAAVAIACLGTIAVPGVRRVAIAA